MKGWQIRFTPYDISGYDISGLLQESPVYAVAWEDKDRFGNKVEFHYHVYLETDECEKTVRNNIGKFLRIPKVGRGKANKFYALPADGYQPEIVDLTNPDGPNLPGYILKWGNVVAYSGYSPASIEYGVKKGREKYLRRVDQTQTALSGDRVAPASGETLIRIIQIEKPAKKFNAYQELYDAYDIMNPEVPSIPDIAKWIRKFYAKKNRAIPMHNLVMRYANSIHGQHAFHVYGPQYDNEDKFWEDYFERQAAFFSAV